MTFPAAPAGAEPVDDAPEHPLVAATRRELVDAGRLDTAFGQAAVLLAQEIARPSQMGSAVAALTRQLHATLDEAKRGAGAVTSPQMLRDELADRRQKHGA